MPKLNPSVHLSLAVACLLVAACKADKSSGQVASATEATVNLAGAGATFPYPLYSKWIAEYQRRVPRARINYQSIGSGAGIRQISERTVDFGATDAPMSDSALAKAPGKLLHIPTTLGAVVITYNLPPPARPAATGDPPGAAGSATGSSAGNHVGHHAGHRAIALKLSPEVIAAIFLGELGSWNDPRLAALNPGLALPAQPITVVHRSDGSGTSAVFTDYLARVSAAWRARVGQGTSVRWPAGLGAKGNEGVTGQVKITPGAIGYVELAYARQNQLAVAAIENRGRRFIEPSIASIGAAAAASAAAIPDDLRVSIVDAPGEAAYPLAAFTYILVYQEMPDQARAETLARFLWWAVHDGQRFCAPLDYAPLPPALVAKVEAKLQRLRSAGRAVLGAP